MMLLFEGFCGPSPRKDFCLCAYKPSSWALCAAASALQSIKMLDYLRLKISSYYLKCEGVDVSSLNVYTTYIMKQFKLLISYTFQYLRSQVQIQGNSLQQMQNARNLQLTKLYSSVYSHGHSSWNIGMKLAFIWFLVMSTSKLNVDFATKKKRK